MMPNQTTVESKSGGGRPPKFAEPSRPVTLTLPESTLEGLRKIDPDRGQAIVKLTNAALRNGSHPQPLVEIVKVATNTGLLVISPCESLRQIPFLHLVEVAPARFLLALRSGHDFKSLELAIRDVFEDVPREETRERQLIAELLTHIRELRQADLVTMAEILFVRLDDGPRRKAK